VAVCFLGFGLNAKARLWPGRNLLYIQFSRWRGKVCQLSLSFIWFALSVLRVVARVWGLDKILGRRRPPRWWVGHPPNPHLRSEMWGTRLYLTTQYCLLI
jgi:hypothetical protein